MQIEKPIIKRIEDTPKALDDYEHQLEQLPADVKERKCILEYPTVYIHSRKDNNGKYDAYVGESNDVFRRTREHFDEAGKKKEWSHLLGGDHTADLWLIGHPHFNKSLTLDVENRFMLYLTAAETINPLINDKSNGQGSYYTSEEVIGIFTEIWQELHQKDRTMFPSVSSIENSAVFKASPFHKLYPDQEDAKNSILTIIHHALLTNNEEKGQLIFVEGESGTGKTVLNSTLFYELCSEEDMTSHEKAWNCHLLVNHEEQLKVYKDIAEKLMLTSVDDDFISKPTPFIKQYYVNNKKKKDSSVDVIFVDEAHLLLSQKRQAYNNGNMIEDLRKIGKVVVLMFDMCQVMHTQDYWTPTYIDGLKSEAMRKKDTSGMSYYYRLTRQMRICGGDEIVNWINNFTDKGSILPIPYDKQYELRVFDSPFDMETQLKGKIHANPEKYHLSRILATFDWPYSNGKKAADDGYWMVKIETPDGIWKMPWNKQLPLDKKNARKERKLSWAEQSQTINEVGSTFTIQGSDLSIAAVILGPSVRFKNGKVWYDGSKHADKKATNKRTLDNGEKMQFAELFIRNEVNVLLKRGVNGLYIYACDPELRKELRRNSVQ
jgi:DUF2075 family protein/DNA replication protein DnaC